MGTSCNNFGHNVTCSFIPLPLFVHNTLNCWLIANITHRFSSVAKRRNYAGAKEFCETAAKNGFKTGRLFEPKTQSFNDKVYAQSIVVSKDSRSRLGTDVVWREKKSKPKVHILQTFLSGIRTT